MSDREDSIEMLTPDELADRLPWIATGVRVALERKDEDGMGLSWVQRLREITERAERLCRQWKREREGAKAPST